MKLGIYGAGGLGREVLEIVRQMKAVPKAWEEVFFVDDEKEFPEGVNGVPIRKFDDVKESYTVAELRFVIAVGEPAARELLFQKVKSHGYSCATLVHPGVHIPATARLNEGAVIQQNAFISCNTCIGENVYIQPAAIVGHDVRIGANSVISMNVAIGGACVIGERVYIGLNVPVRELLTIGSDSIIGMGSVVTRSIPENVIALGNPARPVKKKDDSTVF